VKTIPDTADSHWPHRAAVVLCCATFPLVWIGGLVTSTDAGMAVPDWPTTYGYNLFLYPWQTWLFGPWGLFIEHGHRLFASAVGLLTIALVVVFWRCEPRRWMKGLAIAALILVIVQGVLGGMRVLMNERTLAMIHGCTGPAFFALTAALVVFTSCTWRTVKPTAHERATLAVAVLTTIALYTQLVFGAMLRHVPDLASPQQFYSAVHMHIGMVPIVALLVVAQAWLVKRSASQSSAVRRLSMALVAILVFQIALGVGTWLVKYSVPYWASGWIDPLSASITAGGPLQAIIVTGHVATGSLLLALAVALTLYEARMSRRTTCDTARTPPHFTVRAYA
jgi:cytochrome c oxidase assembly protein subunit 15